MQDLFLSDASDAFYIERPYWSIANDFSGFISMFEYEFLHFDRNTDPNGPFVSGGDNNAYQAGVCGTIQHVITGIAGEELQINA